MTAAWRLLERGYGVTLVERRPYFGGRAYSFVDRETGSSKMTGAIVREAVWRVSALRFKSILRQL